jgi:hypothetical protein
MRKAIVAMVGAFGLLSLVHSATAQTPTPGCVAGAKLEGLWGNSWYPVTVKPGPLKEGWCYVGFDGYSEYWDAHVPELRPRGSGSITSPVKPTANTATSTRANRSANATGAVRDGRYSCGKIVGDFDQIRGAQSTRGSTCPDPVPHGQWQH